MFELKAYTRYIYASDNIETALILKYPNGERSYFQLNEVKYNPQNLEMAKPLIEPFQGHINNEQFLQTILDTAWEHGFRPSGFKDIENETKAIRYHLEDMRKLVFKGK
jgi:hypothetical protein